MPVGSADAAAADVRRLRIALAGGMLAALLIAPRLWFHHPFFGPLPPFEWLPAIPPLLDAAFYGVLVALLPAIAFVARPRLLILAWCALFAIRAALDLSVWQPYFYQYAVMLLSIVAAARGVRGNGELGILNVNRLIVACVYFWSGLNKLNYRFLTAGLEAVPGLQELLSFAMPGVAPASVAPLSVAMPLVEIAIAVGLLLGRRSRRIAGAAAIAMHALVLTSIGPLGRNHNAVVWPWNIAMMAFVWILFLAPADVSARRVLWGAGSTFHRIVLVLFAVCPLLSFADLWPTSLSFRLYTFRLPAADIYINESLRDRLPAATRAHVEAVSVYFNLEPTLGGQATKAGPFVGGLNISDWSERELNAFIPPERRVFERVFDKVCMLARTPTDALLLFVTPPDVLTGATRRSVSPCRKDVE